MKALLAGSLHQQTAFVLGHGQPLLLGRARTRLTYGQQRFNRLVLNANLIQTGGAYLLLVSILQETFRDLTDLVLLVELRLIRADRDCYHFNLKLTDLIKEKNFNGVIKLIKAGAEHLPP